MSLSFGSVTRGSGKVYVRLDVDAEDFGRPVTATSRTARGDEVPASVARLDDLGCYAAIVPVLGVRQLVSVTLHGSEGDETATYAVDPTAAKLESRFNTLTRRRDIEAIRNCDERMRFADTVVKLRRVISDQQEDVLHGSVTMSGPSRGDLAADFDLVVLGADGKPANVSDWINMGDSTAAAPDFSGLYRRTVSYSVRIRASEHSLVIWARPKTPRVGDGFFCADANVLRDLRKDCAEKTTPAEFSPKYEKWFLTKHRASRQTLDVQRAATFAIEPSFSLVVPLFKTPVAYLRDMADSVLAQTYGGFELILVNASPESDELAAEVARYANLDERVKVVSLGGNRGISGNTNEGLKVATGDFVCFLDHDDVIEPDLLFRYARGINDYPETDLLYCDEDKLMDGHYCQPFFKPDWNLDLLRSQNYVCHLLAIRRGILEEMGPIPGEYDGAQDHHMTLFAAERARNVYHARHVLYHWRMHGGSTAASTGAKDYTEIAGARAVQAHLDRVGLSAAVEPIPDLPNAFHVSYLYDAEPLVSVIIPNKDMAPTLETCIEGLLHKTDYENLEIVVVENNSVEEATFDCYERLKELDARIKVVDAGGDGTFNFSRITNYGVAHSSGDYLLMLNNDTEPLTTGWLRDMVGIGLRDDVGAVGAKLLYPDGLIQHAGVLVHKAGPGHIGRLLPASHRGYFSSLQLTRDCSAVTGACLLTRRSLYDALGGLDEDELAVNYNDVDYCLRVRERGLLVAFDSFALLRHYESLSRGMDEAPEKRARFCREFGVMMRRWPSYFASGDPYENPFIWSPHRKLDRNGHGDFFRPPD